MTNEEGWEYYKETMPLRLSDAELLRQAGEALRSVLGACDQGHMVSGGAGAMSIEANIRGSKYNGVPAWPIEEARAILALIDARAKT